jgi:hypothetical protein
LRGDLVIVPYQVSCGRCGPCQAGTFAACRTYMAPIGGSFGFGTMGGGHGGAIADLLLVPAADHLLVTAPAGIPATTLATLSDNVVDGYRSVGPPLATRPGADILIVAEDPGNAALLRHQPGVGAERLHGGLRRPAAAGRAASSPTGVNKSTSPLVPGPAASAGRRRRKPR